MCALVRSYKLNNRRKRGKRGGVKSHPLSLDKTANPKNLLQVNITDRAENKVDLHFLLLNVCSLKNKEFTLRDELDVVDPEFAVVTETWLKDDDIHWLECSQFNRDRYKIVTSNRQHRCGGGLALIHKDKHAVRILESGHKQSFEYMICSIIIDGSVVTLVMIYHPPYSSNNPITPTTFIDQFSQFIPNILTEKDNVMILGDFNLHMDTEDPDPMVFSDILDAMGLTPHVHIPTHKAGHTLDQVYTVLNSKVTIHSCRQGILLSDHYIIHGRFSIYRNIATPTKVISRKLKDMDYKAFMDDINIEAINLTNIDDATNTLKAELLRVLDKHAPLKERKITERKKEPWYEDHVKKQKKTVRNRAKIWKKYKEPHQWKAYTIERNRYNRMLAGSKIRTISEKVVECGTDTKKLYNLINNITGRTKVNPMPPGKSDQILAEEFADFFLSKITKIRNDLATCPVYSPSQIVTEQLGSFEFVSCEDVINTIKSMPTKTCENDIIPTKLLKQILDKIGSIITSIVNLSLSGGVFAKDWKSAIVRPLLKKKGLDLIPKNYRPVSNLPFISKVVEKCMLHQFTAHCDTNNLLPDYQSAYRKNYSCETALVKLHDDILWSMEKQRITAVIAIDLSAAFDTVDHDILLDVLNKRFGVSHTALAWFQSYLRPRDLKVNVGTMYSTEKPLDFSVPQGSVAGPSLYSAYASTMNEIIPTTVDIHGYADDHALKTSFAGSSRNEETDTIQTLQDLAVVIKVWMDQNRLKMNNEKTEFILLGSRQQLCKTNTTEVTINDEIIRRSRCIKYLGAELDERLSMKDMINRKCRIAMGNLQKLRTIRKCLTMGAAKTIALGLVISHLDYANALYAGLPDTDVKKLQRIQNMTAKIVIGVGKYDSSTAALKSLHWLPVHLRIQYKVLTLVFKCIHGSAPGYLCDMIRLSNVTRSGLRSETGQNILNVPFTKRKTFADRTFSVFGPKQWNSLPGEMRSMNNYATFKSKLKTYLFNMF